MLPLLILTQYRRSNRRATYFSAPVSRGFTLIELITVMLVLGIISALGSQFIVSTVDSYREASVRNRLLSKSRVAIEQVTRYLRSAVPNSVRVSSTGNCLEFLPVVAAAFYQPQVADDNNAASLSSSVTTSAFSIDVGSGVHAIIGAFSEDEIYLSASPAARVSLSSALASGTTIYSSLSFSVPHRFIRNSINQRVFVADDPMRFCVRNNQLWLDEAYGLLTSSANDTVPTGAASAIMANSVAADGTAFTLSAGSENRNAGVILSLSFAEENVNLDIEQRVFIRNVP